MQETEIYEIESNNMETSFQRRNYDKIKLAYKILVGLNLIIDFFMIVFLRVGIVKERYFYFVIALLPMDLYLFSWIFHEVVSWGESMRAPDIHEHIYIGTRYETYIQLLLISVLVLQPMEYRSKCIHGEKNIYYTTTVVFAFLFLISLITIRKQKGKITKCMMIALFSLFFAWGLTDATFFLTSSRPVTYVTSVWDSTTFRNHGTYYRVKVLLKDGRMQWLYTTKEVYDEVKDGGGIVVIRDRTGLFDTEFVNVYLPKY